LEIDLQQSQSATLRSSPGILQVLMRELKVSLQFKSQASTTLCMECPEQQLVKCKQQVLEKVKNLNPSRSKLAAQGKENALIFLDFSNLSIGAKDTASGKVASIHLDIKKLNALLQQGWNVKSRHVAGSMSRPDCSSLQQKFEELGYNVSLTTRGAKGEQNVDEYLLAQIHTQALRYHEHGGVLVLGTGDGNLNKEAPGEVASFRNTVETILETMKQWRIELWAWRASCNRHYVHMAESLQYGERFQLYFLDDFRKVVTYRLQTDGPLPRN